MSCEIICLEIEEIINAFFNELPVDSSMFSLEEAKSKRFIQSERGSSLILKVDSPNVKNNNNINFE